MSSSVRLHRRQPTRFPRPWDSLGKNTGVCCHFPLQCMKMKSESEVAQLCLTLSHPMDCSLPGSSIHGIFEARVLEWGAIAFSNNLFYWLSFQLGNRRSVLGVHWKDWCWSWNSNTLATSWEELTHWKRPWCWEGLGTGGEGTTEDEMAGWHHWLDAHEFGWTPGVGDGQGGLVCCDSWGHKESDMTERLNWTELFPNSFTYAVFQIKWPFLFFSSVIEIIFKTSSTLFIM